MYNKNLKKNIEFVNELNSRINAPLIAKNMRIGCVIGYKNENWSSSFIAIGMVTRHGKTITYTESISAMARETELYDDFSFEETEPLTKLPPVVTTFNSIDKLCEHINYWKIIVHNAINNQAINKLD